MKFELYKKMLKGETSPDETRLVMQWLEEEPAFFENAMLEEARQLQPQQMPDTTREQMLQFFRQQGIGKVQPEKVTRVIAIRRMYRWAAVAAILVAACTGWWWLQQAGKKTLSAAWREIHNNQPSVMAIILPDSSKVWLNAYATVRYHEDFNGYAERTVKLTGEAYFKVAHDTIHPFVVQTENLQTRVLGTEFNVEAYPGEQLIKVCLQKGKVQVNCIDTIHPRITNGKVLLPGQMATFYKKNALITIKQTSIAMPEAWIEDALVLNDVALPDALNRISLKYNQQIVFNPLQAAKYKHVTASFKNMDLSQVLSQLGFTCNFSVKKIQNTYRIDLR